MSAVLILTAQGKKVLDFFFCPLGFLSFPVLAKSWPIYVNALVPWQTVDFWNFLFHVLRNASALPCCVCSSALLTYLCPLVLKLLHCPTNPLLKSLFTLVVVRNNSSFIPWATTTMELLSGMRPMHGPTTEGKGKAGVGHRGHCRNPVRGNDEVPCFQWRFLPSYCQEAGLFF